MCGSSRRVRRRRCPRFRPRPAPSRFDAPRRSRPPSAPTAVCAGGKRDLHASRPRPRGLLAKGPALRPLTTRQQSVEAERRRQPRPRRSAAGPAASWSGPLPHPARHRSWPGFRSSPHHALRPGPATPPRLVPLQRGRFTVFGELLQPSSYRPTDVGPAQTPTRFGLERIPVTHAPTPRSSRSATQPAEGGRPRP